MNKYCSVGRKKCHVGKSRQGRSQGTPEWERIPSIFERSEHLHPTVHTIKQLFFFLFYFKMKLDSGETLVLRVPPVQYPRWLPLPRVVTKASFSADGVSKGINLSRLPCLATYISMVCDNKPSPKAPLHQNECIPDYSQLSHFTDSR